MQREYQIQETLRQDSLGTILHAKDETTGKSVVIRYFQPVSPLSEDAAAKFLQWVGLVCQLEIPGLRTVLEGGVNPEDGVPYLVHEWVEGNIIADYEGLGPENWLNVLKFGLELSETVSQKIGMEAMWVEWAMDEILINPHDLGLSFWVQPPLARPGQQEYCTPRQLDQLADWLDAAILRAPELRTALSSWIAVLRATGDRWDFAGLWLSLDKKLHPDAPAPVIASSLLVPPTVPLASQQVQPKPRKSTRGEWIIVSALAVVFLILLGLLLKKSQGTGSEGKKPTEAVQVIERQDAVKTPAPVAESPPTPAPVPATNEVPEPKPPVPAPESARTESVQPVAPASPEPQKSAEPKVVATPGEISGLVKALTQSKSGKTFYFELSETSGGSWVACRATTEGVTLEKLNQYVGKKIKVRGEVNNEKSFRKEVLFFSSLGDLEVLE